MTKFLNLPTKGFHRIADSFRNVFIKGRRPVANGLDAHTNIHEDDDLQRDSDDETEVDDDHFSIASDQDNEEENKRLSLREQMEREKERFPGASGWAADEERLFSILFQRQNLPMLPPHWNVDFRGFPLSENLFDVSEENPPIIYAHSQGRKQEYLATAALTRLIDLTLGVRTIFGSNTQDDEAEYHGQQQRAAELIKSSIDNMTAWAARDGGYADLKVVPNILVEIVHQSQAQEDIVELLKKRMRTLARLQREYLRVDRVEDFWAINDCRLLGFSNKKRNSRSKKYKAGMKRGTETRPSTPQPARQNLAKGLRKTKSSASLVSLSPRIKQESASKKRRLSRKLGYEPDELAELQQSEVSELLNLSGASMRRSTPKRRKTIIKQESDSEEQVSPQSIPTKPEFRRKPPVIYGLFVYNTHVFLLTVDSSKGDGAYVSYHLDINFADNYQSVWNALTVAAVVCLARDDMMSRLDDFKPAPADILSDPDA